MSEAPSLYSVSYSGRALDSVRALISQATGLGLRPEVETALLEIDRCLTIYPQFGEPFRDLSATPGTEWLAFAGPLVVRYVLIEQTRQVWVVRPITWSRATGPRG